MPKDLISVSSFSKEWVYNIFEKATFFKNNLRETYCNKVLEGQSLAMIFHKPSMRTRVSFEVAMNQLGGQAIKLTDKDIEFGKRESIEDIAKNLSRYVQGIMIRTFEHQDVTSLAKSATIPVINGLTDYLHPCQALTDIFSIHEKKKNLQNLKIAYIGDGNNVARSLANIASVLSLNLYIASPPGYTLEKRTDKYLTQTTDPFIAAKDADVIYTDKWVSMGQEKDENKKETAFTNFQINKELLKVAKPDVLIMHCLPAHRGKEITSEVIDSENSIVFDQAENRLHVQKAILSLLL